MHNWKKVFIFFKQEHWQYPLYYIYFLFYILIFNYFLTELLNAIEMNWFFCIDKKQKHNVMILILIELIASKSTKPTTYVYFK